VGAERAPSKSIPYRSDVNSNEWTGIPAGHLLNFRGFRTHGNYRARHPIPAEVLSVAVDSEPHGKL
jgi:hypothetical protein